MRPPDVPREVEYLEEAVEEAEAAARRDPFSIIYRVESGRILIVAVAHGHRRPGYWKSRLQVPG